MQAYEFRRGREIAITLDQDGTNLPGGVVWEPSSIVNAGELRGDIAMVLSDVGFFIWP